jgi:hypothetical protein
MHAALYIGHETHVYELAWKVSPETYERAWHKRVGKLTIGTRMKRAT